MKLQYQAKDRSGQALAGQVEAATLADGRELLRRQGLFLLSLAPAETRQLRRAANAFSLRGRVRTSEVVTWMTQLTIMCQAGVTLVEALEHLSAKAHSKALKAVLQSLYADVASGSTLSQAMRKHPRVFQETFVAGIAAGEQSGNIVPVLERLSTLLRNERRLYSSLLATLTYPVLLCGVMGIVLVGLVFFVLPQFGEVFASFGHPAPPLTQFLLDLGQFSRANVGPLVLAAVVLVGGGVYVSTLPAARRLFDQFLMRAVVIRGAMRMLASGRSFYLLGTMLQSGVPLLECLRLCRSASRNAMFRDLFGRMEHDLLQGQGISGALATADFLPSGAEQMIATAERSGRLGQVLVTIGQHYEEEGEVYLRHIVKLAEPALIIILGFVVATVVMSVMLPLLDASTIVH